MNLSWCLICCASRGRQVVSGAVPIVDQHWSHPDWSWAGDYSEAGASSVASSVAGLAPLPAWPLGWVFPDAPRAGDASIAASGASSSVTSATRPRARTVAQWPAFAEDAALTPWRGLAAKAAAAGPAEVALRRGLNARWYLATVRRLRRAVAEARREHLTGPGNVTRAPIDVAAPSVDVAMSAAGDVVKAPGVCSGTLSLSTQRADSDPSVASFGHRCVVSDDGGLQAAVRFVVERARQSRGAVVRALVEVAAPRVILSETLTVAGSRLDLTLRAATPCVAGQETGGAACAACCIALDGGGAVRVLEVSGGATLRLDGVAIERGFAFGHGAGCRVTGLGSRLLSGRVGEAVKGEQGGCRRAVSFAANEVLGFGGGGLFVGAGAAARLGPCGPRGDVPGPSFMGNAAGSFGGGAAAVGAEAVVELEGAVFAGNAAYRGGALAVADGAAAWAHGGAFQGNAAYWDGGALYVNSAALTVGVSRCGVASGAAFERNAVSLGGSVLHATGSATVGLGLGAPLAAPFTPHASDPGGNTDGLGAERLAACAFTGNEASHGGLFAVRGAAHVAVAVTAMRDVERDDVAAEGLVMGPLTDPAAKEGWRIARSAKQLSRGGLVVLHWAG